MKQEDLDDLSRMLPPSMRHEVKDEMHFRIQCCEAMFVWLKVRELEGFPMPPTMEALQNDIEHSNLLYRLIRGKPPLLHPPPRRYSCPWYELIENGWAIPNDVWCVRGEMEVVIVIDHDPWKLVRVLGVDDFVVSHERAEGLWRVWCTGEEPMKVGVRKLWRIELLRHESADQGVAP